MDPAEVAQFLSSLSPEEQAVIRPVLERDLEFQRREKQRLRLLRTSVDLSKSDLSQKSSVSSMKDSISNESFHSATSGTSGISVSPPPTLSSSSSGRACTQCGCKLGMIFNAGTKCKKCAQLICDSCRIYTTKEKKFWTCPVCFKEREFMAASGEWMDEGVSVPSAPVSEQLLSQLSRLAMDRRNERRTSDIQGTGRVRAPPMRARNLTLPAIHHNNLLFVPDGENIIITDVSGSPMRSPSPASSGGSPRSGSPRGNLGMLGSNLAPAMCPREIIGSPAPRAAPAFPMSPIAQPVNMLPQSIPEDSVPPPESSDISTLPQELRNRRMSWHNANRIRKYNSSGRLACSGGNMREHCDMREGRLQEDWQRRRDLPISPSLPEYHLISKRTTTVNAQSPRSYSHKSICPSTSPSPNYLSPFHEWHSDEKRREEEIVHWKKNASKDDVDEEESIRSRSNTPDCSHSGNSNCGNRLRRGNRDDLQLEDERVRTSRRVDRCVAQRYKERPRESESTNRSGDWRKSEDGGGSEAGGGRGRGGGGRGGGENHSSASLSDSLSVASDFTEFSLGNTTTNTDHSVLSSSTSLNGLVLLGEIELLLSYDVTNGMLDIWVKKCRSLPLFGVHKPNPYVKISLIPQNPKEEIQKQKTSCKRSSVDPIFDEHKRFPTKSKWELEEEKVEISVWHRDLISHNSIIGQTLIPLSTYSWSDDKANSTWFTLEKPIHNPSTQCSTAKMKLNISFIFKIEDRERKIGTIEIFVHSVSIEGRAMGRSSQLAVTARLSSSEKKLVKRRSGWVRRDADVQTHIGQTLSFKSLNLNDLHVRSLKIQLLEHTGFTTRTFLGQAILNDYDHWKDRALSSVCPCELCSIWKKMIYHSSTVITTEIPIKLP